MCGQNLPRRSCSGHQAWPLNTFCFFPAREPAGAWPSTASRATWATLPTARWMGPARTVATRAAPAAAPCATPAAGAEPSPVAALRLALLTEWHNKRTAPHVRQGRKAACCKLLVTACECTHPAGPRCWLLLMPSSTQMFPTLVQTNDPPAGKRPAPLPCQQCGTYIIAVTQP